jgi:hypothetical protein
MILYYLIFLLLIVFFVLGEFDKKYRILFFYASALIFFILAGFRGEGVDGDYGGYVGMFKDAKTISFYLDNAKILFVNNYPMVLLISSISKFILHDGFGLLFIVFAFLGVTFKMKAIKELSQFLLLSVLIYFCHFFLLHEMTQIRAGVATGLLLLSIPSIKDRRFFTFLIYVGIAALFHYTALIFIPFYFINSDKISVPLYLLILIGPLILFLLHFSVHPIIRLFGDNPLTHRYFVYIDANAKGLYLVHNPFNVLILLHLCLSVFFLWKAKSLANHNPYAIILIKIYVFSAAVFYLFSDLPTFAFRFYEVLTVVEIVLIPSIINVFRQKSIVVIGIFIYAFGLLSINLLHSNLLQSFHFR